MEIALGILSVFALALAAPGIYRLAGDATGWLVAAVPLALCIYFLTFVESVGSGEVYAVAHPWVPGLDIDLAFYIDGWSLLFAVLITLVGALVLIYAGAYLHGHPLIGRFYLFILLFMGSMLGLVLADNLLLAFVFWELTSISSYFLIGFDCRREASRAAALQALLITGAGGLALLAGFVLLAQVTGGAAISDFLASGEQVRQHGLYDPILFLVLLGAFTKSAQVPFHFWLPSAMEAPTPVSAYLHSATMVKAGVYLLGRLSPVLSGTDAWLYTVTFTGAVTMVFAAWLTLRQEDLKRILAYSTISALGVLVMLLGIGTEGSARAAAAFLLAHALYKGALFLVAGAVDHETGTRNVNLLGGLRRAMPLTATAAILAALSMAGIVPFFGFIGKELVYEAVFHAAAVPALLTAAAVFSSMLFVNVAAVVGIYPFLSNQAGKTPKHPHEGPLGLWLGPLLLASFGLLAGIMAASVAAPLLAARRQVVALGRICLHVVELPPVLVERRQRHHDPWRRVPGNGRPAIVIDAPVAEHLEVLGRVALGGVLGVKRVGHAHAVHWPLAHTINRLRLGNAGSLEDRRGDVDHVMELGPRRRVGLDAVGPRHGEWLPRAAEVRGDELDPKVAGDGRAAARLRRSGQRDTEHQQTEQNRTHRPGRHRRIVPAPRGCRCRVTVLRTAARLQACDRRAAIADNTRAHACRALARDALAMDRALDPRRRAARPPRRAACRSSSARPATPSARPWPTRKVCSTPRSTPRPAWSPSSSTTWWATTTGSTSST